MKEFYLIVVTYEPDIHRLINMATVINKCGCNLVVVDNSEKKPISEETALQFDFVLFSLQENFGIAHAQNIGIDYVIKKQGKYISFFDQDSIFNQHFLLELYNTINNNENIVISPLIKDQDTNDELYNYKLNSLGYPKKIYSSNNLKTPVDFIISSGLTCAVATLLKVGFMNEDFFIDYVDTEWCLRCRKYQIQIFVFSNILMYHKIGNSVVQQLGYKTNIHSIYRTYYKFRNIFLFNASKDVPLFMKIHGLLSVYFHAFLQFLNSPNKKCFVMILIEATKDGLKMVVGKKNFNMRRNSLCQ